METITEAKPEPLEQTPLEDLSLIKEETLNCGCGSRFLEKN